MNVQNPDSAQFIHSKFGTLLNTCFGKSEGVPDTQDSPPPPPGYGPDSLISI